MLVSRVVADPRRLRRFVRFLSPPPQAQALDIWLGPGALARALAPRVGRLVAVQRDDLPRRWRRPPNLELVRLPGLSAELPFPDEAFDLLTCGRPFHHLPRPAAALAEMWRVCRPGGWLALEEIVAHEQEVRARYQDRLERLRDRSHPRYFRLSELLHLLGEAGFLVRRLRVVDLQREFNEWLLGAHPRPQKVELMRRLLRGGQEADLSGLDIRTMDDTFVFTQRVAWLVAERLP
jgi:SAM-dependent methyltransferase